MKRIAALLAALASTLVLPVAAKPSKQGYDVREFVCPIGGKKFRQDVGYSSFPLITLPDGSWFGDTEIGTQVPVCPKSGLVLLPDRALSEVSGRGRILYSSYSAKERELLPSLIADPDYVMLSADGPYAQAWWLATRLNRPAVDRFFMLQRSTWATSDPAKRKRLVARFANEAPAIVDAFKAGESTKRSSMIYVVNALRELGRFGEAAALLDQLDRSGSDSEDGSGEYLYQLRLAIAQKDDGRFAAEMVPQPVFEDLCNGRLAALYGPTLTATRTSCQIRRGREAKEAADY